MSLNVELRLNTGDFQTSSYFMLVRNNQIVLLPVFPYAERQTVIISGDDLTTVSINSRNAEIKIQTKENAFSGVLTTLCDLDSLYQVLKNQLNTNVQFISEDIPIYSGQNCPIHNTVALFGS